MHQKTVLSHNDAMKIINAILDRANEEGQTLAAAVVDEHGELIAFLRTDGCRYSSINIALNKAYTSAREHVDSLEMGKRAMNPDGGFPMTNFGELRYVTWGGGVPIRHNGEVIGAVGVSGMPMETDIDYANYGIATLK